MSALVRRHFSSIQDATRALRHHSLPIRHPRPASSLPNPTWASFGGAFAGLRTGIRKELGHGVNRQGTRGSCVTSLGTPSLLFHDRRAPRPQQISRCGPIALQIRVALFHASRPNQGLPFVWLATLLKTSTALAFAQTAGRITMSLLPILFLKLKFSSKFLRKVPVDHPHYAQKREKILRIRWKLWVAVGVLVVVPLTLFVSAILASLERTPLTGRMRLIMLSAEEEEEIARELKGAGWYTSVAQILVNASPSGTMPRVIPPDDWRWNWVEQTLRQLERAIPKLQEHSDNPAAWYAAWIKDHPGETISVDGPEWKTTYPIPPPPHYPLVPRPRVAQLLHEIPISPTVEGHKHGHGHHHSPHAQLGPPYSLLLVDLPESNALSYGFGGDGGGGIVVYSGFLDEVLGPATPAPKAESNKSWLGGLFSTTDNSPPAMPQPTPEQTKKLATLLAHELSHLLLSHHLETLSSGTIFLPSVIGIVSDVVRVLLFPITMVMGPFVNDAVANFTKVGLDDIARSGSTCQSRELEFEADMVSARILASAGFDPRCAVEFWEGRQLSPPSTSDAHQIDTDPSLRVVTPLPSVPGTFWTSRASAAGGDDSHPLDQARVRKLRKELKRWEREKAYAMGKMKIDSWARGACEASVKGLKWKWDKKGCEKDWASK